MLWNIFLLACTEMFLVLKSHHLFILSTINSLVSCFHLRKIIGLNSFLQDLLSRYTNEDEQIRRFESHNFNGSFPYLKTIKILNFYGFVLPLVKYLLKHAIVLEKFDIVAAFQGSDASLDYVTMAQELLSYPRSSPHASVVFSYR